MQLGVSNTSVRTIRYRPIAWVSRRVSTLGRNSASELIFMVPGDLSAEHYDLEVRALFGQEEVRSGRLHALIAVAT